MSRSVFRLFFNILHIIERESHPAGWLLFLCQFLYFAALAARMASVSIGVTLNRSPQMP